MLLRFRGPDGTVRINVEQNDTFDNVAQKVLRLQHHSSLILLNANIVQLSEVLPDNVDFNTVMLSNRQAAGGETKLLKEIRRFKVEAIGVA